MTKEIVTVIFDRIQGNAEWIDGLGKMMSKVVEGMDDLTKRVEKLEKKDLP